MLWLLVPSAAGTMSNSDNAKSLLFYNTRRFFFELSLCPQWSNKPLSGLYSPQLTFKNRVWKDFTVSEIGSGWDPTLFWKFVYILCNFIMTDSPWVCFIIWLVKTWPLCATFYWQSAAFFPHFNINGHYQKIGKEQRASQSRKSQIYDRFNAIMTVKPYNDKNSAPKSSATIAAKVTWQTNRQKP